MVLIAWGWGGRLGRELGNRENPKIGVIGVQTKEREFAMGLWRKVRARVKF